MRKFLWFWIVLGIILVLLATFWIVYEYRHNCGDSICGNSLAFDENYTSCSIDCPSCDDNDSCTSDRYDYEVQKCVNEFLPNCDGNGICEVGEFNLSIDCPSCDDNDKCTSDDYDYKNEKCINLFAEDCCGNGICEEGEDYLNCEKECEKPMKLNELKFAYDCEECYNQEGDFFRVYGDKLLERGYTVGDGELSNIYLIQYLEFNEKISDFDVKLECEDSFGNKINAKGNYGWAQLERDGETILTFDDVFFICDSGDCKDKTIDDMVGVSSASGGTAKFEFQLLVNPNYDLSLNCDGEINSKNPKQSVNFNFEIDYRGII